MIESPLSPGRLKLCGRSNPYGATYVKAIECARISLMPLSQLVWDFRSTRIAAISPAGSLVACRTYR